MIFSDKVIISDPCYTFTDETLILPILIGEYQATVYMQKGRVEEVQVKHTDYENEDLCWDEVGHISVIAGEAGIFDYSLKDLLGANEDYIASQAFYDKCGDLTDNANGYGEDFNFFISRTGFGDGYYPVYVAKNKQNKIFAISIRYIEDEMEAD